MVLHEEEYQGDRCWIEWRETGYWVFLRGGRSARGPFVTQEEAEAALRHWKC